MPRIPAMLVTRDTRLPARSEASLRRISPVGRSMVSAGALGLEGDENMYESDAVWTLMSRKGSAAMVVLFGLSPETQESEGEKVRKNRKEGRKWRERKKGRSEGELRVWLQDSNSDSGFDFD